jgi:hypothetical protein
VTLLSMAAAAVLVGVSGLALHLVWQIDRFAGPQAPARRQPAPTPVISLERRAA